MRWRVQVWLSCAGAQALAIFAVRACEKLRARGQVTAAVWVFAHSDAFRPELRQHNVSRTVGLPASTADTTVVLAVVRKLLRGLLRDGIGYKKSGVALFDLAPPDELQGSVRAVGGRQSEADGHHGPDQPEVRARHGRPWRIWLARAASVGMWQHMLSPNYATSVHAIPTARC